jgi:hypothetical protein
MCSQRQADINVFIHTRGFSGVSSIQLSSFCDRRFSVLDDPAAQAFPDGRWRQQARVILKRPTVCDQIKLPLFLCHKEDETMRIFTYEI